MPTKKELIKFLTEITEEEDIEDAQKVVQDVFNGSKQLAGMIQTMGIISITVTTSGAHKFVMSPHLQNSLQGLDMVEKAFRDVQEKVITPQRRALIEQMENEEEPETIEEGEPEEQK